MRRPLDEFLDMQEHPENYSNEQLERMMADIDREPNAEAAWARFEQQHKQRPALHWLRVAAVFIGVLAIAGITFAAIQLFAPLSSPEGDTNILQSNEAPSGAVGGTSPVHFDNAPLDSILTVVSAHYGKAVSFRDDAMRRMKLIMTWHPEAPLADFLSRLNAFDGLSLQLQNDTVIVVQTEEKEGNR